MDSRELNKRLNDRVQEIKQQQETGMIADPETYYMVQVLIPEHLLQEAHQVGRIHDIDPREVIIDQLKDETLHLYIMDEPTESLAIAAYALVDPEVLYRKIHN